MVRLLIASRNAHKVAEMESLLGPGFRCLSLEGLAGAPKVREEAGTFAGNVTRKAVEIAAWVSRTGAKASEPPDYVVADDSGLEVDALNGRPGVFSARFAAPGADANSSDEANNRTLLRMMEGVSAEQRTARFRCVVALTPVRSGGETELQAQTRLFEGTCEGSVGEEPRGDHGFGYDPLFVPVGEHRSFAEMGEREKNRISHRAKALEGLRAFLTREREADRGS